jgi:hypothetical protein
VLADAVAIFCWAKYAAMFVLMELMGIKTPTWTLLTRKLHAFTKKRGRYLGPH